MTATAPLTLQRFRRKAGLSMHGIVRDMYRSRCGQFQVRNEPVAVRNLTRIIEATLTLANRKGFAAMSLRDLAGAVGMSLGGLYAYFASKEDLVTLIQSHARTLVASALSDAIATQTPSREQLHAAIRAHLYLSEILRAWFFFSYMEARHLPAEERQKAVASELHTESLLHDVIVSGQQAGEFRNCDASLVSAQLKALLQDWYLKRRKYRDRGVTVEHYAESVIEIMDRMLR